ncbi:hypothetical protein C1645_813908 [Glomus cerebriforme]|uniref:CCHC-type domain-containing protein n=1 Tax=Glomus cerebriforme TaxID=658196 RepID=A0A397TJG2_9GLOM|nr:hypothetical protein C1645_813908 [Glomus cerebriforme]
MEYYEIIKYNKDVKMYENCQEIKGIIKKGLHEKEKHEENGKRYQVDPSCLECYKVKEESEPEWFKKFWRIFQKVILEAIDYNRNTIEKQEELEGVMEKGEKLLDVIVVSMRYRNKPDYKKIGIVSVIKIICEHYMFDENDNLIIKEKETEENLLENRELLKYGYIIEDDEVDRRFVKLEEWLREKGIAIMDIHGTMNHFKEMLHMVKSIANKESRDTVRKFQKSLTYRWWDSRYQQPWKNDDLTNEIIRKIVEEKSFIREYKKGAIQNPKTQNPDRPKSRHSKSQQVQNPETQNPDRVKIPTEELESSEDESELGQVKKLVKEWKGEEDIRTIGKINLMLETGYELEEIERNELIRNVLIDDEIDIQELKRKLENGELPLRVKGKMTLKDKDDDEKEKEIIIAEKWREKGHTRITIAGIKRLLRLGYDEFRVENDIELINKYVRYRDLLDDELKTKLDELDNEAETEKRSKGLKRINEKFIELFQENKNEKEEDIKEILEEYLRKQTEIGESSKKKEEKEKYLEHGEGCVKIECRWVIRDEYEEFSKKEESFKKEIREEEYFWNGEKYEKIKAIITEDIDEWMRESMKSFGMKDNDKEENLKCKICGNKGHNKENCAEKEGERFQDRRETDYWEENIKEEKDDTDESEKIGEILSPGEHEDWDENIEDINENEIEDELQNIINTGGFGLSQNSELYSLLLNFENSDTKARLLERAAELPNGTLDNPLVPGESMAERIANIGNEVGIVNMPPFSEREDEDVSDWVRKFEVVFIAMEKAAGANGIRNAAYVVSALYVDTNN